MRKLSYSEKKLVEEALPVVAQSVGKNLRRFPNNKRFRDDLYQAGALGLMSAAQYYKPEFKVPFGAFARPAVERAIYNSVFTSRSLFGKFDPNAKARGTVEARVPSPAGPEAAEVLPAPTGNVEEVLDGVKLMEGLEDALTAEAIQLAAYNRKDTAFQARRAARAFILGDIMGKTQAEVGEELGVATRWAITFVQRGRVAFERWAKQIREEA